MKPSGPLREIRERKIGRIVPVLSGMVELDQKFCERIDKCQNGANVKKRLIKKEPQRSPAPVLSKDQKKLLQLRLINPEESVQLSTTEKDTKYFSEKWKFRATSTAANDGRASVDDIDKDGTPDVFIGSGSKKVYRLNGKTGEIVWEYVVPFGIVSNIAYFLADLDNDGWKDLFVTNGIRRDVNNKDFYNEHRDFFDKMENDPKGLQNLLEFLWDYIRDLARTQIGEKVYRDWMPFIGTLFLFVFVSNWGGALIPWRLIKLPSGELGAPTADINTTIALALLVSLSYFYAGLSNKGWRYFEYYVHPTPIMLPFKILEDFTKPLSLSFRLFGNILADELVVGVLVFLVPLILPIPVMFLGLFTSAIQALIFATLAAYYIGEAVEEHH